MARRKKRNYSLNPVNYSNIKIPLKIEGEEIYEWQKEILEYWGDLALRSGRQVGKSETIALKCAIAALKYQGFKILVSAGAERQAEYIFEKIKQNLKSIEEDVFADNPTMRLMKLKNGSEIYCLPTGRTGDLIRGLTLDVWVPDEAAYINDQVRIAVDPMLWKSKKKGFGWTWALSTTSPNRGFFFNFFDKKQFPNFKTFHVSSEDCPHLSEEKIKEWKRTKTRREYAQEVLGEWVDEITRLFPDKLLDACFKSTLPYLYNAYKTLGVDVARFGGDKNAFVEALMNNKRIYVPFAECSERKSIYETFQKICDLNNNKSFNRILIDDAGVGGGLADFLIEKFRSKIICTNNATKVVDNNGKTKGLLKENMYSYAILQMEQGNVDIKENEELRYSLECMQAIDEDGKLKIIGRDSHLAEAFVRAMWGMKAKGLNSFVYWA